MKNTILLILLSFTSISVYGQDDLARKDFGRTLFKSFILHDFESIIKHLAPRNNTERFKTTLKEAYVSGQKDNIVWSEVVIDDLFILEEPLNKHKAIYISFMWEAVTYEWMIHDIDFSRDNNSFKILSPLVSFRTKNLYLSNDK